MKPPVSPAARAAQLVWILGLVSLLGLVLGLSLSEDGSNQWSRVHAWGALALAGAVLTLAPAIHTALNLSARHAWQIAACGAATLVLFWVLFTLPSVGSNTSLLTTVGVAAGVASAWLAPGRDLPDGATGPKQPAGHDW